MPIRIDHNPFYRIEAAKLITRAFPSGFLQFLGKKNTDVNVVDLWNALMFARSECGSNELGKCMKWARKIMSEGSNDKKIREICKN